MPIGHSVAISSGPRALRLFAPRVSSPGLTTPSDPGFGGLLNCLLPPVIEAPEQGIIGSPTLPVNAAAKKKNIPPTPGGRLYGRERTGGNGAVSDAVEVVPKTSPLPTLHFRQVVAAQLSLVPQSTPAPQPAQVLQAPPVLPSLSEVQSPPPLEAIPNQSLPPEIRPTSRSRSSPSEPPSTLSPDLAPTSNGQSLNYQRAASPDAAPTVPVAGSVAFDLRISAGSLPDSTVGKHGLAGQTSSTDDLAPSDLYRRPLPSPATPSVRALLATAALDLGLTSETVAVDSVAGMDRATKPTDQSPASSSANPAMVPPLGTLENVRAVEASRTQVLRTLPLSQPAETAGAVNEVAPVWTPLEPPPFVEDLVSRVSRSTERSSDLIGHLPLPSLALSEPPLVTPPSPPKLRILVEPTPNVPLAVAPAKEGDSIQPVQPLAIRSSPRIEWSATPRFENPVPTDSAPAAPPQKDRPRNVPVSADAGSVKPSPMPVSVLDSAAPASLDAKPTRANESTCDVGPGAETAPLAATSVPHPTAAKEVSLRLRAGDATNINVQLRQRGSTVDVTVRSDSPGLTRALQTDLSDLVGRLQERGYKTDAWTPAEARHTASTLQPSSSNPESSHHSGSGQSSPEQQERSSSNQRQPSRQHLPWTTQLDDSLTEIETTKESL